MMRLFFRDHIPFFILYFFNMFFLFGAYEWMGGFENNLFYFFFLSTFLLVCYLMYKYFSSKELYKRLSEPAITLEAYLSSTGKTPLSQGLDELFRKQYELYRNQIQIHVKRQNEHLEFMNQWVHQMKTPLSVIQLMIQENEGEPYIEDIREEVERLNSGLNMALYMARVEVFEHDFHVEQVVLKAVVLDVVNELKRLFIRKYIYPEVKVEEGMMVYSDKKWVTFILQQLLTNAIKYSEGKNKKIIVTAYKKGKEIIVEVKDQGVGIVKEDIKRVCEPFYTGKNGRKFGESTGMGLYLVYKVCEKLNHEIRLESEEGKGTIIGISFKNTNITTM